MLFPKVLFKLPICSLMSPWRPFGSSNIWSFNFSSSFNTMFFINTGRLGKGRVYGRRGQAWDTRGSRCSWQTSSEYLQSKSCIQSLLNLLQHFVLIRVLWCNLQNRLGQWNYKSKRHSIMHEGHMFSFLVEKQLDKWDEKNFRERKWVSVWVLNSKDPD